MRTFPVLTCLAALSFFGAGTGSVDACEWFRRGDTNNDGVVDLTDGVTTLNFLFLGGDLPECSDAADADDSGDVALVDAVVTFNFLFLGASALAAPGPFVCGPDPSEDRLSCFSGCEPPPTPLMAADFEVFAYEQSPALGFCPDLQRIFSAIVTRETDGPYRFEYTVLEPAEPGAPDCIPVIQSEDCFVAVPMPSRSLDADEAALLQDLFVSVPLQPDPAPICDCIAIDPCVIPEFTWDGVRGSGFDCSFSRLPYDFVMEVLAALEGLRSRAR